MQKKSVSLYIYICYKKHVMTVTKSKRASFQSHDTMDTPCKDTCWGEYSEARVVPSPTASLLDEIDRISSNENFRFTWNNTSISKERLAFTRDVPKVMSPIFFYSTWMGSTWGDCKLHCYDNLHTHNMKVSSLLQILTVWD